MAEHCCGPTREQAQEAVMRGDVIGTWPRCSKCAKKEQELWDMIQPFIIRTDS